MVDRDRHAPAGQCARHGLAEAAAGAGHQGDAAAELHQSPRGAIGRISPVGAPGRSAANAITPCVTSSSSTYAAFAPTAATLSVVRVMPGATAFTRIFRSASSSARLRVKPATAALAATYTAIGLCGSKYAIDA